MIQLLDMIPKHDDIRLPALELLKDGNVRPTRGLEEPLARHFGLTEEERSRRYESGAGPIFYDRIGWAMSYLSMSGLVERPKRGHYRIGADGLRLLATPEKVEDIIRERLAERDRQKKEAAQTSATVEEMTAEDASELTPKERLTESFKKIQRSVYEDILDTILSKSPREFEKLVVALLQEMGYGGEVEDAGEVTQYTNDGGIDGVIREDVLGLGRIHIQAKRYAKKNTVGRDEIQKFVGALAVAQSNKGVFITTSSYSPGAIGYAKSLHGGTTLVLIDGQELAKFIYDYGLGMQVEETIEIKKLDGDYWDNLQDG